MERRLAEGMLVVLFPEGTSSDGTRVLPFRSSLFQAAIAAEAGIRAAHLAYEVKDGRPETDVCYWGEMTMLPHVLKLFSKPSVCAHARFSMSSRKFSNRKAAAREMYQEVVALAAKQPLATAV
jgi:1-acyl-sn-glycerol-3-phosphate acyltransferase